jgi:hypothetical protein
VSGEDLLARELEMHDRLVATWRTDVVPHLPDRFEDVPWEDVEAWVNLVASIKGSAPPTWRAKVSHFVAAHIFPVADDKVLNLGRWQYRSWFELAQRSWAEVADDLREDLTNIMKVEVGTSWSDDYPVATKVCELVRMGQVASRSR